MVGNTIFGVLSGERPIDWKSVHKDIVQRLYSSMGKSKATPFCPYIFHLYHTNECLLQSKKKDYRIAKALLKHVEPKEEGEPEALEDLKCESLSSEDVHEI